MKQHITPSQLDELTLEGKEKLRKWWKPVEHDIYFDGDINTWEQDMDGCISFNDVTKMTGLGGDNTEPWEKAYPLLSIGQMIEFLREHEYVGASYYGKEETQIIHNRGSREICDSLWGEVKEVLE